MKPLVTVLYEDSKIGPEYPLHKLILRMVEDEINGQTWKLLKLVQDNPRNGIDKVLHDVRAASLIAREGRLFVLVDRDVLIRHVNKNKKADESLLPATASDDELVAAVRATAGDAADRVSVFLLHPAMEGLISAIETCAPGQWTADIQRAKAKDRVSRDFVLGEATKAAQASLRNCLRDKQPGLSALAKALAQIVPREATL